MPQSFQEREASRAAQSDREPRRRPSAGGAGHWLTTAGVLAPLVIGELVKDPDQRWRFIRISSVALASISEGLYAHKVHKEREELDRERGR
jgi:hypothetical protein